MSNQKKQPGYGDRKTGQTIRKALKQIHGKNVPGSAKPAGGDDRKPKKK